MKQLSTTILALVLTGCAIPYTPPTSGPVAKIKLINNSERNLIISYYNESTQCKARRFTEIIPPKAKREDIVRANQELTFQYHLTNFNGAREEYCLVNLRFLPIAEGFYNFQTSESEKTCKWLMTDATHGSNLSSVSLKKIEWKRGLSEDSSFCNE
jgi:hypothetical protein